MLDTYTQAMKILHLDHLSSDWIRAANATPATIMGLEGRGVLKVGMPADLMVLRARSYSEMLARHQFDRAVLRAGRGIDTRLPHYREVDDLVGQPRIRRADPLDSPPASAGAPRSGFDAPYCRGNNPAKGACSLMSSSGPLLKNSSCIAFTPILM